MCGMKRPVAFESWLAAHAGVFTRKAALEAGVSDSRFRTGVKRGEWIRYYGVWRVADTPPGYLSRVWAAVLRAGPGARITAHTALVIRGLEIPDAPVVLALPASRHVELAEVRILRDTCPDPNHLSIGGLPSVSRSRAVIDAVRIASPSAGREILHEALRLGWITATELQGASDTLAGHRGISRLRDLAKYAASGSRAESEARFIRLLKGAGFDGWQFNQAVHAQNGKLIGIADALHEESRLIVELDGFAWHSQVDRFQRDRTRQNALFLAGWSVLRFTWDDLTQRPYYVLSTIHRYLDGRESEVRSS